VPDADWPNAHRDLAGRVFALTQSQRQWSRLLVKGWSFKLQPETGNLTGTEVFQEVTRSLSRCDVHARRKPHFVALEPEIGK